MKTAVLAGKRTRQKRAVIQLSASAPVTATLEEILHQRLERQNQIELSYWKVLNCELRYNSPNYVLQGFATGFYFLI